MRSLSFLLAVVTVGGFSCLTSSDLERRYPFDGCPTACPANAEGTCICPDVEDCPAGETCCPKGSEPNEAGECVADAVNNDQTNNTEECTADNPDCCQENSADCCGANGDECCKNDGVWVRCEELNHNANSDNTDGRPASDIAIVISDATQACEPNGDNELGADFYGMKVWVGGEQVELDVLAVASGDGGQMFPESADLAQVLVNNTGDGLECHEGESVPLGCGKVLGVQIANGGLRLDPGKNIKVLVLESGPDCDGREDVYRVQICSVQELTNGNEDGCLTSPELFEGNADPIFPISEIP